MADIEALILCGGLGTRLRPAVGETQKVMAQINGRPFLDRILEYLRGQGLRRVILGTGYQAGQVEAHYRNARMDLEIGFSREEQPLGTGGAVKQALSMLRGDPFLVLNGDSFCPLDYAALLRFHHQHHAPVTIVVSKPAGQAALSDYGCIRLESDGRVRSFEEKTEASGGWRNAGVYCCSSSVAAFFPDRPAFSLEYDVFQALAGKAYGFPTDAEFLDIGTPERFTAAGERSRESREEPS